MRDAFSLRDTRGRAFWGIFLLIGLLTIFFGFEQPVSDRFSGAEKYPASNALVLHVWTMGAWIVLLMVQLALAGSSRISWHRTLGLSAFLLIPAALLTGFWAEVLSERHWEVRFPDYVRFLHVPIAQMGGFGIFGVLAIVWRRRPSIHRRMIYLATASVVAGAWGRALRPDFVEPLLDGSPAIIYEWIRHHFGFMIMALAAVIFDWRTRGAVHPALGWGAGLMIFTMGVLTALTLTDWWPDFGRALIGL